jgi:hypothetical protein
LVRPEEPNLHTSFFVSYAHAGPDSNQKAERLFDELRDGVATMVAAPMGAPMGFFDVEGLQAAVKWRDELADMLGNCQVLVALLSVPYINSEWCGKEWHAFTLRERVPLAGANSIQNQGAIIPVRWAPIAQLPAVVSDQQIFMPKNTKELPDLRKNYEEDGIFGLLKTGKETAFNEIVWQLAKRIAQIHNSQLLRPRVFEQDDLIDIFRGEMP